MFSLEDLSFEAEIDMVSHKISQMHKRSVTSVVHHNRGIHYIRYDYYGQYDYHGYYDVDGYDLIIVSTIFYMAIVVNDNIFSVAAMMDMLFS